MFPISVVEVEVRIRKPRQKMYLTNPVLDVCLIVWRTHPNPPVVPPGEVEIWPKLYPGMGQTPYTLETTAFTVDLMQK